MRLISRARPFFKNYLQTLKEFRVLSRRQKAQALIPLGLVLTAGVLIPINLFGPRPKIRSPLSLGGWSEVSISRLAPAPEASPFERLFQKKTLGFKSVANRPQKLQYETFGYLPYWSFEEIPFLRLDLLSTIAYFALEIDPAEGELLKDGAYWNYWNSAVFKELVTFASRSGTRTVTTLKLFDNGPIEQFLLCNRCQEKTVEELVREIKDKNTPGVNVDFEYLGTPPGEITIRFAQFMKNLTDKVHKEIPGSQVSMATYATSAREERIHNVDLVGSFIDYVVIMGYDFFRPGSSHAGPVSPLTGVEKYGYDLQTSVQDFLSKIPAEKIVLGVPYYGYDWPVEGNSPNSKVLEFSEANDGLRVPYYQDSARLEEESPKLIDWDETAGVPFYTYFDQEFKVWRQMYFENVRSLREKFSYVKNKKIRGLGIWALGFDGARPELWELLEKTFTRL